MAKEKRKWKGAITRQLNELVGMVAGVSSGVEPRRSEEINEIKATLEHLQNIKEKNFRNTGRITDVVSGAKEH